MKTPLKQRLSVLLCLTAATAIFSGCMDKSGPVPESWYRLPEEGSANNPGDLIKLGSVVDRFFEAHSASMQPFSASLGGNGAGEMDQPVDWVPWRLAAMSTEFGITTDGLFGALFSEGSASVVTKWIRADEGGASFSTDRTGLIESKKKRPDLLITGTATSAAVVRQLEPSIRAALATGRIKNETALRKTLLSTAETFRHLTSRLSTLEVDENRFQPSAFRLEIAVDGEGQLTPVVSAGAEVKFRLDWVINNEDEGGTRIAANTTNSSDRIGKGIEDFVRSIAPDLDAAVRETPSIDQSGFKLSKVRVGLGISASYDFGVAESSASMMGSIVFGDNEEEGGCYDPDGDGDCHTHKRHHHSVQRALQAQNLVTPASVDEGIRLIEISPKSQHLGYANATGIKLQALQSLSSMRAAPQNVPGAPDAVVYTIKHEDFRKGLMRAIDMAGFFTQHASTAQLSGWKIKEIETEYSVSLSGTLGLATVGGAGEIELEFENGKI